MNPHPAASPPNSKEDQQQQEVQKEEGEKEVGSITNWGYFALYSYFYVIQGIVSGFAATMPYLYSQLPSESTMAIFNSTDLPFSFKFLIGK